MAVAPRPSEIFERAAEEGERRLDQSLLELTATGFIAGFTIVFGIAALGIVHAAVAPHSSGLAGVAGALAFAIGLVFLIVGRAELFTENFFDPAATVAKRTVAKRREAGGAPRGLLARLLRLWGVTFVLNLAGGALFALVMAVPGVLPAGTAGALSTVAEDLAARGPGAGFASAVVGGGLVALMSFLLQATDGVGSRVVVAYLVGFLLALGPFDHVIVTVLHVFFGVLFDASVGFEDLARVMAVATAGNIVGGLGLVTLSHIAQAEGADESGG
jgi:formate/nitrite transporter FocA (FNT family)